MVGYRDLSGNSPVNHTLNQEEESTAPAVRFGAVFDPRSTITVFASPARSLYIGAAGNLAITGMDGTSVLFTGLLAGSVLPVQ